MSRPSVARMEPIDRVLAPWWEPLAGLLGDLTPYDAHTHLGAADPDGYRQEADELLDALDPIGARAVTFPMHEPDGYPPANDRVLAAAAAAPDRLVAFARVDPRAAAVAEARRCLDAGARGIKLHPRAEGFTLEEPAVEELFALAHERRLPILVHAGRGIPALGENAVTLTRRYPDARLILAHAAVSDLAWIWAEMPDHPNLLIDTAWWSPGDMMAAFKLIPSGQIVWASDSPYGRPMSAAVAHLRFAIQAGVGTAALRCALQAGLGPDAVRSIAGGQMERLLEGEPGADAGPPPMRVAPLDPHLERVVTHLVTAMGRAFARTDPEEPIALARLACAVGDDQPCSAVCAAVIELLDLYEANKHHPPTDGRRERPGASWSPRWRSRGPRTSPCRGPSSSPRRRRRPGPCRPGRRCRCPAGACSRRRRAWSAAAGRRASPRRRRGARRTAGSARSRSRRAAPRSAGRPGGRRSRSAPSRGWRPWAV